MSDYEKYEPKTRGEHKEEHGPEPDFPEPEFSEHCDDCISASNMLGTIVALIDRGNTSEARRYAHSCEAIFDEKVRIIMDGAGELILKEGRPL